MMYDACTDCGKEKNTPSSRGCARCSSCAKKGNKNVAGHTFNRGRIHTKQTRQNMSIAHNGNGDVGEGTERRYRGQVSWRNSVKETFSCCVICRSTKNLEAHHIAPKARYPELASFRLNGLTLCFDCHRGENGVHSKEKENEL